MRIATGGVVFVLCLILGLVSETIAVDDSYIAGYAAAVLQHEFDTGKASLHVQEGVVIVDAKSLGTVDRTKVMTALESIPGVVRVEIREDQAHTDVRESPPISQEPTKPESKFLPHGLLVAPFHATRDGRISPWRTVKLHWVSRAIPARPILVKRLHSIATRLLWMANGKSLSRPESSVYSI